MQRLRSAVIGIALATAALTPACLQDRDTLSKEALGNLDVIDTIVGRFERNPPLYYQMRLARVSHEIKTKPNQLDLYDDAAVACDRLGLDDDAIRWIEAKRTHMAPLNMHNAQSVFHWYRYYANCGTFWAHRWVGHGAKVAELKDLKFARSYIAKAIEVNPDAHGGREGYQLMTMDWLIGVKEGKIKDQLLGEYIEGKLRKDPNRPIQMEMESASPEYTEAIKGLCGLIQLGAAWRSVDAYVALDFILQEKEANIGHLAGLRAYELYGSGAHSILPMLDDNFAQLAKASDGDDLVDNMIMSMPRYQRTADGKVNSEFKHLRENADKWAANREAFMMAKLSQGKHPDTDPDFWKGYVEVPRYQLYTPTRTLVRFWISAGAFLLLLFVGSWLLIRTIRRRAARRVFTSENV